jgi:hypothetical protein
MEDVQHTDCVVHTYGNIIATTQVERQRRASEDGFLGSLLSPRELTDEAIHHGSASTFAVSYVFASKTTKFSLAHECESCRLLVCASCKDSILAAQEARVKEEED